MAKKSISKEPKKLLGRDLTPLQVEARRKELEIVKKSQMSGFVAYLCDDRAIVTQNRKSHLQSNPES